MSQQAFSWSRVFAMLCGIFSLLFAGQIGLVAALGAPRGAPIAAFACVGAFALLPLLFGILLYDRSRLLHFLSLYCFGLAAMSALYFACLVAPHLIPALANELSLESQQFIQTVQIRWIPPIALIGYMIFAGAGLFVLDRRACRVAARDLEIVDLPVAGEPDIVSSSESGTVEQSTRWPRCPFRVLYACLAIYTAGVVAAYVFGEFTTPGMSMAAAVLAAQLILLVAGAKGFGERYPDAHALAAGDDPSVPAVNANALPQSGRPLDAEVPLGLAGILAMGAAVYWCLFKFHGQWFRMSVVQVAVFLAAGACWWAVDTIVSRRRAIARERHGEDEERLPNSPSGTNGYGQVVWPYSVLTVAIIVAACVPELALSALLGASELPWFLSPTGYLLLVSGGFALIVASQSHYRFQHRAGVGTLVIGMAVFGTTAVINYPYEEVPEVRWDKLLGGADPDEIPPFEPLVFEKQPLSPTVVPSAVELFEESLTGEAPAQTNDGYLLTRLQVSARNASRGLAMSADGKWLYLVHDEAIEQYDLSSFAGVRRIVLSSRLESLAVCQEGLLVALPDSAKLCVIEPATLELRKTFDLPFVGPDDTVVRLSSGPETPLVAVLYRRPDQKRRLDHLLLIDIEKDLLLLRKSGDNLMKGIRNSGRVVGYVNLTTAVVNRDGTLLLFNSPTRGPLRSVCRFSIRENEITCDHRQKYQWDELVRDGVKSIEGIDLQSRWGCHAGPYMYQPLGHDGLHICNTESGELIKIRVDTYGLDSPYDGLRVHPDGNKCVVWSPKGDYVYWIELTE